MEIFAQHLFQAFEKRGKTEARQWHHLDPTERAQWEAVAEAAFDALHADRSDVLFTELELLGKINKPVYST